MGKSDPIDAEAAAGAALSGAARVTPKRRDGAVEQMWVLMIARRSARRQRNRTLNLLRQVVFTSPYEIRARFNDRYKAGLVSEAARMRPRKGSDPVTYTTCVVIRGLARRIRDLNDEMHTIDHALKDLIKDTAPSLLDCYGVGVVTAGTLLFAAGGNPDRLPTERSWPHLRGVTPHPDRVGQPADGSGSTVARTGKPKLCSTRSSSPRRPR